MGEADRQCPVCGVTFQPRRASSKFCSRPCMWSKNGRTRKSRATESWWKGPKGYITGRVLIDGKLVNVKQHRIVAAKALGRPILPSEDVHHIDHCRDNNDPSNLLVISHGDHSSFHNKSRVYKRGYKLRMTDEDRLARADRMRAMRHAAMRKSGGQQ